MKFRMAAVLFAAGAICCGAEGDVPGNPGSRRDFGGFRGQNGGGRFNRRGMGQNRVFVEAEIAAKFPKEYAELEAKREAYEAELKALAAKAELELPEGRDEAYRKLRKAAPAEFDAAAAKMKTSPREGFAALRELAEKHGIELFGSRMSGMNPGGRRMMPGAGMNTPAPGAVEGGSRRFNRPDMGELRRKYPEKMQQYDSLRRTDREKARAMLLEIIEHDKSVKK